LVCGQQKQTKGVFVCFWFKKHPPQTNPQTTPPPQKPHPTQPKNVGGCGFVGVGLGGWWGGGGGGVSLRQKGEGKLFTIPGGNGENLRRPEEAI